MGSEGVLTEFFREHREEIVEMGIFEFDQELYEKAIREDGYDEGKADGYDEGKADGYKEGETNGIKKGEAAGIEKSCLVYKQIQSGNTDSKAIAEACGCSVEAVVEIRRQFGI